MMSLTTKTYEEAVHILTSLQSLPVLENQDTKVEETRKLLKRSGVSTKSLNRLSVIHVTGTKGKGSTCAFTESILRHHGVRTGFFSSPHLVEVRERIRINGEPISRQLFTKYFWEVYKKLKKHLHDDATMPLFFKFMVVMALNVFIKEKVEVAIIEVGLGGQNDCTNLFKHPVAVGISSLGLDHVSLLGHTVELIAGQKAGIMKPAAPAFTVTRQPGHSLDVLRERAEQIGCTLTVCPPLSDYSWPDVEPRQLGLDSSVQQLNASLAIHLAHTWLIKQGPRDADISTNPLVLDVGTARGLRLAKWPGRAHVVHRAGNLSFYLDGAHTTESIQNCLDWFIRVSRRLYPDAVRVLVFNSTGEREPEVLMKPLCRSRMFEHVAFCPNIESLPKVEEQDVWTMTSHYQLHRSFVHADAWLQLCTSLFEAEEPPPFQDEAAAVVPLEVAGMVLEDEQEELQEIARQDEAVPQEAAGLFVPQEEQGLQDEARALPQEDKKAVVPYVEKRGYEVDISQWITHDDQGRMRPETHRNDVNKVFECVINSEAYECVVGPKMYQMNQELQIVYNVQVTPPNTAEDTASEQFEKEPAPTLYLTIINPDQGEMNPRSGVQITELENSPQRREIALPVRQEEFERNQGEFAFQLQQREMAPVIYQGVVAPLENQSEMVPSFYQGEMSNQMYQEGIVPQVYQEAMVPQMYQENITSFVNQGEMVPQPYQGEIVRQMYQGEMMPQMYQAEVIPQIYQRDMLPTFYQGQINPQIHQENMVPISYQGGIANQLYCTDVAHQVYRGGNVPTLYQMASQRFQGELSHLLSQGVVAPYQGEMIPSTVYQGEINHQVYQQQDITPQLYQRQVVPFVPQGEMVPQVYQSEMLPQLYQGEMLPQLYQGEMVPQVYQGEMVPQEYQGDMEVNQLYQSMMELQIDQGESDLQLMQEEPQRQIDPRLYQEDEAVPHAAREELILEGIEEGGNIPEGGEALQVLPEELEPPPYIGDVDPQVYRRNVRVFPSVADTLTWVDSITTNEYTLHVLFTGSLHLVGCALNLLEPQEETDQSP